MVRKIGARMGLRFLLPALEVVVKETGGHPALIRTLGDLVDQRVPTSGRYSASVDVAVVQNELPRFSTAVDEDMRELVEAASDIDPGASEYLVSLAHRTPWAGEPSRARLIDALVSYGILHPDSQEFRIGRLATWLRENHAAPVRVAHG